MSARTATILGGLFVLVFAGLMLFLPRTRGAEVHIEYRHLAGHADYNNWSSGKTANCCNNDDCHLLEDGEWRETDHGDEIKILDQWCPVEQRHYVTRGKSPDWDKAHACILTTGDHYFPCERLLCFMGTGAF